MGMTRAEEAVASYFGCALPADAIIDIAKHVDFNPGGIGFTIRPEGYDVMDAYLPEGVSTDEFIESLFPGIGRR